MIVIIEGIDRVGKSTQIQKLQTALANKNRQAHVLKYSDIKNVSNIIAEKINKKYYDEMFHICWILNNEYFDVILDRAHLGEMVYSPIYREYSGEYIYEIEDEWNKHTSMFDELYLITIIDEARNVIKREDGKSLSGENIERKQKEIGRFELAHNLSSINNKLLLNISGKDIEQCHEEIMKFLNV